MNKKRSKIIKNLTTKKVPFKRGFFNAEIWSENRFRKSLMRDYAKFDLGPIKRELIKRISRAMYEQQFAINELMKMQIQPYEFDHSDMDDFAFRAGLSHFASVKIKSPIIINVSAV